MSGTPGTTGTVIVGWYATGLRADAFEAAVNEIAPVALRYGASSYAVYRSYEDRYRFQQLAQFDDHADWERYWDGPEMTDFRARCSGWYQVPVLYAWWDLTTAGAIGAAPPARAADASNGHANGTLAAREA